MHNEIKNWPGIPFQCRNFIRSEFYLNDVAFSSEMDKVNRITSVSMYVGTPLINSSMAIKSALRNELH